MSGSRITIILVGLWVLVQILSFWMSAGIEGPRNIDTGFKKLDVWFRWQLLAVCVAIIAAIFGFFSSDKSWRTRIIGLIPAVITLVAAVGLYLFVALADGGSVSTNTPERPTTAPAAPLPKSN